MTKTIHFHWENRFVLQWYGAVRKLYQNTFYKIKMHSYALLRVTTNLNVFIQIELLCHACCSGTPDAIIYNFTLPT